MALYVPGMLRRKGLVREAMFTRIFPRVIGIDEAVCDVVTGSRLIIEIALGHEILILYFFSLV